MPRPRNEFPNFEGKGDALRQMFRALPRVVGNMAVNFYKDRFRRQGWHDNSFSRWPDRKRPEKGARRAVLVKSGRLRRSIRIINTTFNSVTVGTDVPYAKIHNEGGQVNVSQSVKRHDRKAHRRRVRGREQRVKAHSVKAHTRSFSATIPQRKYMGRSRLLTKRIVMHINKQIDNLS
ncbi:MAG: phage virion morphogenesis protein [Bacteroidota bacterium]